MLIDHIYNCPPITYKGTPEYVGNLIAECGTGTQRPKALCCSSEMIDTEALVSTSMSTVCFSIKRDTWMGWGLLGCETGHVTSHVILICTCRLACLLYQCIPYQIQRLLVWDTPSDFAHSGQMSKLPTTKTGDCPLPPQTPQTPSPQRTGPAHPPPPLCQRSE